HRCFMNKIFQVGLPNRFGRCNQVEMSCVLIPLLLQDPSVKKAHPKKKARLPSPLKAPLKAVLFKAMPEIASAIGGIKDAERGSPVEQRSVLADCRDIPVWSYNIRYEMRFISMLHWCNRQIAEGQVVDVSSFEDFLNLMETSRSDQRRAAAHSGTKAAEAEAAAKAKAAESTASSSSRIIKAIATTSTTGCTSAFQGNARPLEARAAMGSGL
ncbi:unnamed protein product, partial [Cladocopium goreaui]